MKHRPILKHAVGDWAAYKLNNPGMTVIARYAHIGVIYLFRRTLKQLQVYVMSTNKCSCNAIPCVARSRINQDTAKY